jgi:DTW domain-containing protein YfiP
MHPKEFKKTKNGTGRMTHNSLENSEIHIGIDFSNNKRINELLNSSEYEPYVLYPGENTIKLNKQKLPTEKKSLIFIIDSTWPCSKKMLKVSKNIGNLQRVSFEHTKSSEFKIKTQPNQHCLSTIESTLCVLEQLNKHQTENIKESQLDSFLQPFEQMVDYQIDCVKNRLGEVRYKQNFKKLI